MTTAKRNRTQHEQNGNRHDLGGGSYWVHAVLDDEHEERAERADHAVTGRGDEC